MKPGLRGTQSPHTVESVMKLKSHDSQYRSSPPELLAFHPAAQEVGEGANCRAARSGPETPRIVIDSVSQEGEQLAPGALNLKNINM